MVETVLFEYGVKKVVEYTVGDLLWHIATVLLISYASRASIPPDQGNKHSVPTDTKNKLPVVYGQREVSGSITFADISSDNRTMHYIVSICEAPIEAIDEVYWDNRRIRPVGGTWTTATQVGTNGAIDENAVVYDFLDSNFQMAVYPEGGRCTQMETNSTLWNTNRTQRTMPNVAYVYIQLTYNRDERITRLNDRLRFRVRGKKLSRLIINSDNSNYNAIVTPVYTDNPVDCLLDYLLNDRYGAGLSIDDIDTRSFNDHKLHCIEDVTYTDEGGNSITDQDRYVTDLIIDTTKTIGDNLLALTIGNSSSISWKNNKFGIVSYRRKTSQFSFSEANIFGNMEIMKLGFQKKLNELTVRYTEEKELYTEHQEIFKTPSGSKNINEPRLEKTMYIPGVTRNSQAQRIGNIMLLRSRHDLAIKFTTNMSALELEAGDVISVSHATTGWTNKLFEIESITEKLTDNYIQIEISASEYSNDMYPTGVITENIVTDNVRFPNPNEKITISSLAGTENTDIVEPNVQLTWASSNSAHVDYFEVDFKKNSDTTWTSAPNVVNPSADINTLEENTAYNFRVRALSINGVLGGYSTTLNVTTAVQRSGDTTGSDTNGNYMISTNGTIIQWGSISNVEINSNTSVTLPNSFNNTNYVVSITATNLDNGTTSSPLSVRSKTVSAFTVHAITGTTDANWIAIGT